MIIRVLKGARARTRARGRASWYSDPVLLLMVKMINDANELVPNYYLLSLSNS